MVIYRANYVLENLDMVNNISSEKYNELKLTVTGTENIVVNTSETVRVVVKQMLQEHLRLKKKLQK